LWQRQDQEGSRSTESDPADCHRALIPDWLVTQGQRVTHLLDLGQQREHHARLL